MGVSAIALRNSGHLGRIGHWAELEDASGIVSLNFVNTSGLGMFVVPAGGIDRRLSVNPVTMGVPVSGSHPVVLDIAAAATAEGKLKVARNKSMPVPDGWILDSPALPEALRPVIAIARGMGVLLLAGESTSIAMPTCGQ